MPIKFVPFIPEPVEGQAVLGNFNRILRYKGADEVSMTLQRGMPLLWASPSKRNIGARILIHSLEESPKRY